VRGQGSGFRVSGFMVYGLWFIVYGLWFMVLGCRALESRRFLLIPADI
jgi:hypothetical protein